ncbi:MAG: DUF763 domain-containing protein [Actinomycetota bacterium]
MATALDLLPAPGYALRLEPHPRFTDQSGEVPVTSALKAQSQCRATLEGSGSRGLAPRVDELGIYICGGRGRFSRNTPQELRLIAERRGFDGEALVRTSRLTARVDNNAIRR